MPSLASRFSTADVEAARDELARRNLRDFAISVDIPTVPITEGNEWYETRRLAGLAAHHALLCSKLQGIEDGTVPNLMVLMPPGSAKSTYVDVVFVPWFMARKPRRNVILASYASDIATKQGRRARQLLMSTAAQRILRTSLMPEKKAADDWVLGNGSEYMAGGILAGLTGNRAALGVLDDPIRGREAAESKTIRDKTWDAYTDDFCSRLIPGAPQVMILTRWHQDDPAGRILPEDWSGESGIFEGRDGRTWHVLCLPAVADRRDDPLGRKLGESLWPEWFNDEHWAPFKRNARTWSSLYQQQPAPEEGTFFKREWFRRYDVRPPNLHYYMTSDHAPGDGSESDWNVFRIWGVDPNNHVYMIDGFRSQGTMDVALGIDTKGETGNAELADFGGLPLIKKWKPLCWFPEDDNNWKASQAFIRAAMRRLNVHCRIEPISPHGQDKPTKARAIQAKASMSEVWIPNGEAGDAMINEFITFPAGKNDDEVDNASIIGRVLDEMHPAIVPAPRVDPNPRDYRGPQRRDSAGFFG